MLGIASRRATAIAAALTAGLGVACTSEAPAPAVGSSTADSAGVTIVVNHRPAWDSAGGGEIVADADWSIGAENEPEEQVLHGVSHVRRAGDGILVGQQTDITLFAEDGRRLRQYGRSGQGPGEFVRIGSMAACDDGVLATDLVRPAISAFDWSGAVRTSRLPPLAPGALTSLMLRHCTPAGILGVALGARPRDADSVVVRPPLHVVRMGRDTGTLDTLLTVPGREVRAGLQVPFGRHGLVAFGDTLIYTADSGEPEVRVHDPSGALRRIVRLALPARPVTSADVARIREQYLQGAPPPVQAEIEPRFAAIPIPERMPYFSDLHVGADGTVWLQSYQPFRDEPVTRWHVVSDGGRWLGDVAMPPTFRPHHFLADRVVGVSVDADGVERVRQHTIRWPAQPEQAR